MFSVVICVSHRDLYYWVELLLQRKRFRLFLHMSQ